VQKCVSIYGRYCAAYCRAFRVSSVNDEEVPLLAAAVLETVGLIQVSKTREHDVPCNVDNGAVYRGSQAGGVCDAEGFDCGCSWNKHVMICCNSGTRRCTRPLMYLRCNESRALAILQSLI
jgi:hypothetical protein